MTIKIQELENLQDLTEVELEKVVGGQVSNEVEERLRDIRNNLNQQFPNLAVPDGIIANIIDVILNTEPQGDAPSLVQL